MDDILSASWLIKPACRKIRILIGEGLREISIQFVFIYQTLRTIAFIQEIAYIFGVLLRR